MKILNVYYGVKSYDFDHEPYHYKSLQRASDGDITYAREKAEQDLKVENCFWYLVSVLDLCPYTGEAVSTTFYNSVPEKQKIVLNAPARPSTKKKPGVLYHPVNDLIWNMNEAQKVVNTL